MKRLPPELRQYQSLKLLMKENILLLSDTRNKKS